MYIQVFKYILQDTRRYPTGILGEGEAQYVPRGHLELYTRGNTYAAQDPQAMGAILCMHMHLLLLTYMYTRVGFNTIMYYILVRI
jgi:hypothetical protein